GWRRLVLEAVVAEVMHVLDKRGHLLARVALPKDRSSCYRALHPITRQCLTQNGDKRSVARQEHAIRVAIPVHVARRHIKAYQGLTSARNAGHEADRLSALRARLLDDLVNRERRHCQVPRTRVAAGNTL